MSKTNPFQRKKVSELPEAMKNAIFQQNRELLAARDKVSELKKQSEATKELLKGKVTELMTENVRVIKEINNQIAKLSSKLIEVVDYMGSSRASAANSSGTSSL